jgi:thioredoxin reductase
VPGEESPKVVYRLSDPAQYDGQAVLVVGGGDSALEAALALCERPGTDVTLSYRSAAFSRVKQKNRSALERAERERRVRVELESTVEAIEPERVRLQTRAGAQTLPNQAVIVCAGGVLPTAVLQKAGVLFETKYGAA